MQQKGMLVVNDRLAVPLRELRFTFSRSGGPGGQNVNKVSTKATLRWHVAQSNALPQDVRQRFTERFAGRITAGGELVISSQRYRDQARNVADCLAKLQQMILAVAEPPKARKPTRPPKQAQVARLAEKRRVAEKKRQRRPPSLDE